MQKTKGKRLVFEILFALLLLALLIALLVTELSRAGEAYFYERVNTAAFLQSDRTVGYIFRNEIAPTTLNNGPIDYTVKDGTPVNSGDTLAHVYRDADNTDRRGRAAALYAEIEELESALAAASDWKSSYVENYTALMRELSAGSTASLALIQNTAAALGGRDAQNGQDAISSRIAALRLELNELTAHTQDHLDTDASSEGVFYHTADGYEALFGTNQIEHLTPSALDKLLSAEPTLDGVIGKLVCPGRWYLAVPLKRALTAGYTQGNAYPVHFENGSIPMTLERIYTDDTENALLIFGSEESPAWLSPARKQSMTVEKGQLTGLCIPADALSQSNTVFVLENGIAKEKAVTPMLYEQGCVLLSPHNGALAEGEYVIVSTKQLFDGKVLK